MLEQKEFTIDAMKGKFRVGKINAIEALALQTQIDFDNMAKTEATFTFILEHTEVLVNDMWIPVKEKGRQVYYPAGLENNAMAMHQIIMWFLANVIKPLFQKSNG